MKSFLLTGEIIEFRKYIYAHQEYYSVLTYFHVVEYMYLIKKNQLYKECCTQVILWNIGAQKAMNAHVYVASF